MTFVRRTLLFTFLLATLSPAALAQDDSKAQCSTANDRSIQLRKEGKLIDARQELLKCAAPSCPDIIRDTCEQRLATVNAAMPSVVFDVKSAQGQTLTAVSVAMDGKPLLEQLDGRAVAIDPGMHAFTFTTKEGRAEQQVMVREGAKDFLVSVTLKPDAPAPPPAQSSAPPPPPPPIDNAPHDTTPAASSGGWMKTTGYVVGGVGVAGLVLGSVFGLVAISQNNDAKCDSSDFCDKPQSRKDAQGSATISTIGFVAGGVLAAGGITLVMLAPKSDAAAPPPAGWNARTFFANGGAGMSIGRSF